MSVRIMSIVWDSQLGPNEKLVLLALADFANDNGENAWPSVATIAQKTSLGERTVQRKLIEMIQSGLITRDGRGPRGTNRYHISRSAIENYRQPAPQEGVTVTGCQGDGVSLTTKRGVTMTPGGVTVTPQGCQGDTGGGVTDDKKGCHGDTRTIINHLTDKHPEPLNDPSADPNTPNTPNTPNAANLWDAVRGQLAQSISRPHYEQYLLQTQAIGWGNGVLSIGSYNQYTRDFLEKRLTALASQKLSGLLNQSARVRFVCLNV